MKSPKLLAPVLKIVVTGLLLFLVFRSVHPSKIRQDLARLEVDRLALLLIASWIGQLFCTQRWRLFAGSLGMSTSYRTSLQIYFASMLFNVGLPSLVGGDLIKAYMISRKTGASLHRGLASAVQDRAAGLISLLVYGSIAIMLYPMNWRGFPLWLIYLSTWVGAATIIWLAWKGDWIYRRWLVPGSRPLVRKTVAMLADFHQALGTMQISRLETLQVAAISFFNSALVLWMFQQVSVAGRHPLSLVGFSALFPLITLITMLPFSLGGLGIREWAYLEALSLLNVPPNVALTIALTSSALIIVSDLAGVFFLPTIPTELRPKTGSQSLQP